MKSAFFALVLLALIGASNVSAQEKAASSLFKLPSVELMNTQGEKVNTAALSNDGKPIIISFWATWCKPCVKELNAIAELYPDWQTESGVKLIAVSIDDPRSSGQVKTMVNGKGWDYEVLLDPNSDFKRAMNVNSVPHTFVVNSQGEVVWQHTSYSEGAELELYEVVKKVAAGLPLE